MMVRSAEESRARNEVPFLFVGGALALDFVNTAIVLHGQPADLLPEEADLLRWLEQSGAASSAQLRTMRAAPAAVRRSWLEEAKTVRSELHRVFVRLAGSQPLRSNDLRVLDGALNQAEVRLSLQVRSGRPHLETETCGSPTPAFLIARAAGEFLATADLSRVRQCEGTGCILLFYDTTRSHTRRWCSMAGCGNRSKVAAHYHRHRTG